MAVLQTESMLRKGGSGVGGGSSTTTRESQYSRVHLYVYESFQNIIIMNYLIIWLEITGIIWSLRNTRMGLENNEITHLIQDSEIWDNYYHLGMEVIR